MAQIYLDNAATAGYTPIDEIVVNTITKAMKNCWQNPSSLYANDVKEEINRCRGQIARFIGAKPDEIIFTSGASESNNMAIRGWVDNEISDNFEKKYNNLIVITTPIEHKSIIKSVESEVLGAGAWYCNVDEFGLIDTNHLDKLLYYQLGKPILVSVGMANNEIGTIQNIKEVSKLVHRYNGVLHVDATQAFGHIPINVEELGIDMMSASGHKISPVLKGIGFLYKKNCINIQPLIYGSQEYGLRGGTENTFGIIGLANAIKYCDTSQKNIDEMCKKRDYLIDSLKSKFNCKLNGHSEQRLPNNINITFPQNITGEGLLYTLDISDIKISTGSACNSKEIAPSHVLKGIGLTDEEILKTIRISLPSDIRYQDIDDIINEIDKSIRLIE